MIIKGLQMSFEKMPCVAKNKKAKVKAWDFPTASFKVCEQLKDKTARLNNLADELLKQAFKEAGV